MESNVGSDDDDDDERGDDDYSKAGDGSKSDDETSLPTGAVAGNEIHVHNE